MMLAFSTSWNADGRYTARGLLATLRGFRIEAIELSYHHSAADVAELDACRRALGMRIESVHNFCPAAENAGKRSLSEALLLSSTDEGERKAAVEAARRSIRTAASCGGGALIVHLGRVEIESPTRTLIGIYREGGKGSARFRAIRDRMVKRRALAARRYFENAVRSLEELCPEASGAGVELAVENRFYHREIPSLDECRELLERFRGAPVGYWHDTGHAQVIENLGFWRQEDCLEAADGRISGFHFHDALLCEDHAPPSSGIINFRRLRRYLRPGVHAVVELSPLVDAASAARGVEFLRGELGVQ